MTPPKNSMKSVLKTGALMIVVAGVASLVTSFVSWMHRRSALSILVTVPRTRGGQAGQETITLTTTSDADGDPAIPKPMEKTS